MKRIFGDAIVGQWAGVGWFLFPRELKDRQEEFDWKENHPDLKPGYLGPFIKETGEPLRYDEAE